MGRKRFHADDIPRLAKRVLRGGKRRATWFALRAGGRLLHPLVGARAPISGLSLTREAAAQSGGRFVDLDPEREIRFGPAPSRSFLATPTFCAHLGGARVLGAQPAVISRDNRLLSDVSPVVAASAWRHPDLMRAVLPPPKRIEGSTALISSVLAHRYYHWMFDVLPRLDLIARAQSPFDRLIAHTEFSFQRETLRALGVRPEQIASPDETAHYVCERLILPSLPSPFAKPTPDICAFLRRAFLPASLKGDARRVLYVTRKDAQRRRVLNEDEIVDRLARFETEIVTLDGMSVADQAALFTQARLVIGPHGAGFTNIVFAPPGAAVIEFMPDAFGNPCFEILAGLVGANYASLESRSGAPPNLDQTVDADAVEQAVEALLLRS